MKRAPRYMIIAAGAMPRMMTKVIMMMKMMVTLMMGMVFKAIERINDYTALSIYHKK